MFKKQYQDKGYGKVMVLTRLANLSVIQLLSTECPHVKSVDITGYPWMAAPLSIVTEILKSVHYSGLSISRVRRPGLSNFSPGVAPIAFNKSDGLA